jgi:hypothetical protein
MSQKTIDLSAPDNRYFSGFRDVDGKVYGPRLVETEVAFATYGVVIPQVCGLSRLSGNIIWSKNLEERIEERNGIFYSNYSATFAVSFGYPVNLDSTGTDLIRVWLNGRLVLDTRKASRGIVNGFNYTWYDGTQDAADEIIAAEEGADNTPAFKGQMYLVIENLDVSTFENKVHTLLSRSATSKLSMRPTPPSPRRRTPATCLRLRRSTGPRSVCMLSTPTGRIPSRPSMCLEIPHPF